MTGRAVGSTADDEELKSRHARNFDDLNDAFAGEPFDAHLRFLNFGYRPLDSEGRLGPRLGAAFPNRDSAQLLFQVIGDAEIDGRDIVEIGCGRGGNLWLLRRTHEPASVTGVDLSARCIDFARESVVDDPEARFVVGDAEDVPLGADSADIVLSVETSCTYPHVEAFFREVRRLLRPSGRFLWTDLVPVSLVDAHLRVLTGLGFEVDHRRDITENVLAARTARAARQRKAFGDRPVGDLPAVAEFVGDEGSEFHRALRDGSHRYLLFRLTLADDGPAPDGDLFTTEEQNRIRSNAEMGARLLALPSLTADGTPTDG